MSEPPSLAEFALPPDDPRTVLSRRITDAVRSLPSYFRSATNIEGIQATDLFSLNTLLGTTLEVQVVETLNAMRDVWDPDDEWATYRFDRQAAQFPDVLLRRHTDDGPEVVLGVELKGWYVLSLEKKPTFRYTVTPDGCSLWDLLVVVPWHLSNVLSGTPRVGVPGIWPAKYAAVYRNWWWKHGRATTMDTDVVSPEGVRPYETRNHTSDRPVSDGGSNFGRIARIGIMDDWVNTTLDGDLAGVATRRWIEFLLATKEQQT